jgi:hypothetical protein
MSTGPECLLCGAWLDEKDLERFMTYCIDCIDAHNVHACAPRHCDTCAAKAKGAPFNSLTGDPVFEMED